MCVRVKEYFGNGFLKPTGGELPYTRVDSVLNVNRTARESGVNSPGDRSDHCSGGGGGM